MFSSFAIEYLFISAAELTTTVITTSALSVCQSGYQLITPFDFIPNTCFKGFLSANIWYNWKKKVKSLFHLLHVFQSVF